MTFQQTLNMIQLAVACEHCIMTGNACGAYVYARMAARYAVTL